MSKRFTRLKRSLGFSDRNTFHSWRGTVITMLERAGVPEGSLATTQRYVEGDTEAKRKLVNLI